MHLFVALGRVYVVDVGLVNPERVAQYKPVLAAGYRGERAPPSHEVRLVADATQLGRALEGRLWRMSMIKEIQAGSGVQQCSRTVPVRELSLLPQQQQRHFETPTAIEPSLRAPRAPHPGHFWSGR